MSRPAPRLAGRRGGVNSTDSRQENLVYIWWTAHANRSTAVPISVLHANGTATTSFNQQVGASHWVLHGQYTFNAGTGGYVQASAANGQAAADAVRWVPVP